MKWYLFGIILTFVVFNSCKRSSVIHEEIEIVSVAPDPCFSDQITPIYFPGEMLYGRVSGLKNCLPFMASAKLFLYDLEGGFGTDIAIETFEKWSVDLYVRKELVYLGALAGRTGTYSFYFPQHNDYFANYSTLQDYDVFEDAFELDISYDKNEITFDILDRKAGFAKGYFNCRFLLSSTHPSGNNPDTVTFDQCYFIAEVK